MNNFKEELMLNGNKKEDPFKAKIRFAGTDFLVYDFFEYEGEKYYYIIEDKSEEFKEESDLTKFFEDDSKSIRIEFIYEADKQTHLYQTVTDENLLRVLNAEEAKRILNGEV